MADHKITDFVDQSAIDGLKRLKEEMLEAKDTYIQTATELAKGLKVSVDGLDQLEKLTKQTAELQRQAAEATQRHSAALDEQGRIVANTTNTISRQLMEQERVNKTQREAYTETDRVKKLLEQYNDSYDDHIKRLMSLDAQLKANKKEQKDLEQSFKMGRTSLAQYQESMATLITNQRLLTQEKRTLTQLMTAEEKAMQTAEGSYVQLSQQLELMKKAYKDMSAEGRESDLGKEFENAIQNLDARLKDMAADMGEFQRNVGNYAIAGRDGIVTTESLMAAINQQAITIKDLADQNKILEEARTMLDSSDANYATTLEALNSKLAENRQKLTDVSDIMNVQATSVAEAEAQNKRLTEALKNVDLTSENATATTAALNKKIEENNRIIQANAAGGQSIKKSLKELVLEIANLTIEYNKLSEAEKESAEVQALAEHIRELTEQAGELKDAISDTNEAIANAASDTRGFDQLSEGVQLAIDGFGLATGAAQMLGISEGELAEVQTKLQAAIAASNAMSKIQTALQKQSALMQGVANLQTKAGAIAIRLKTAAEGKGIITTKLLTAAQWLFNKACMANPIGLLVVAITACIAAVAGLIKIFNIFGSDSEKRKEQLKQEAETLDKLGKIYERNTEFLKVMGKSEAVVMASSLSNLKKLSDAWASHYYKIIDLYDSDSEEYKEALQKKNEAWEKHQDALYEANNVLTKMFAEEGRKQLEEQAEKFGILQTYKENKIREEAEEWKQLYKQIRTEMGIWTQEAQDTFDKRMDEIAERRINEERDAVQKKAEEDEKKRRDAAAKAAAELKKEVEKGEDALLLLIKDSLERELETEMLSYDRKRKELQSRLVKIKDTKSKMYIAIARQIEGLEQQHRDKLEQLELKGEERSLKTQSSLIASHLAIVQKGSQDELEWKLKSLENEHEQELLSIKKQESEHTLTTEEANEIRANLVRKYAKLEKELRESFAKDMADKIQQDYATRQVISDNAYQKEIVAIEKWYAEQIKLAGNNTEKLEELERERQRRINSASDGYAVETARTEVEMLEKVAEQEELSADERIKVYAALQRAKIALDKAETEAAIQAIEQKYEAEKEASDKNIANIQKWADKAKEAVSSVNDLMSALFDARIERIEAEQEANTEAGEAEQERIAQLVEQNVITEEEGEARKRAAEERTAKKNEELEKKKQQLKYKQAMWDKANSIAQVGISTALAIMNALQMKPFPVGIAMAAIAGAMGAVQLATVLATPIPKYAKGTKDHPGGLAIVGDGGRQEVVSYGGNMFLTPDTPTLIDMPKGAEVFPDADKLLASNLDLAGVMRHFGDTPQVVVNNDYSDLKREVVTLGDLIKMQTKAQIKAQRRIANGTNYEHLKAAYGL